MSPGNWPAPTRPASFPGAAAPAGPAPAAGVLRTARRLVEVVSEQLGPGRVAQLRHRVGLDLADPLAGDAVDLADLVQRLGLSVGQPEPHRHDAGLALGERAEDRLQLLLQQDEADRL